MLGAGGRENPAYPGLSRANFSNPEVSGGATACVEFRRSLEGCCEFGRCHPNQLAIGLQWSDDSATPGHILPPAPWPLPYATCPGFTISQQPGTALDKSRAAALSPFTPCDISLFERQRITLSTVLCVLAHSPSYLSSSRLDLLLTTKVGCTPLFYLLIMSCLCFFNLS